MADDDWLTERFQASRPRLAAVAYRMLGSRAEADDAVQETWIRLQRSDAEQVENLGGWLTTVVARVCLDRLRSRRARPEEPVGPRPAIGAVATSDADDPATRAVLAESVGAALLLVLDLLTPAERVAFVLHDVFAVPFEEIAGILGRSPDATRQLASRARRRIRVSTRGTVVDLNHQRAVVDAFLRAAQGGDFVALVELLDPDVVLRPDAAAVHMGSLRETRGAAAVAGALSGGARGAQPAVVDGVAGLVWAPGGRIRGVITFTVEDDRIVAIDVLGDAERLRDLDVVTIEQPR